MGKIVPVIFFALCIMCSVGAYAEWEGAGYYTVGGSNNVVFFSAVPNNTSNITYIGPVQGNGGQGGAGGTGGKATVFNKNIGVNKNFNSNKNTNINSNLNSNKNTNTNLNLNDSSNQIDIQGNTNDVSQTVQSPEIPTNYNFTQAPNMVMPDMQYDMTRFVANTATSLFDVIKIWQYEAIGQWALPENTKVVEEVLGRGKGYTELKVIKNRTDIGNKTYKILAVGTLYATDADVFRTQMEKYVLAQAKALGANTIVEGPCNVQIETKQKGLGVGGGFSGTMLERFGSFALNIPVGLSWGMSTGNGIAKPFLGYQIVEVME